MTEISTGYVNIFVSDFQAALDFYQHTLRLPLIFADDEFRYAAFATPGAQLAIVETNEEELVGRHTGVGLTVEDLDEAHRSLKETVKFVTKPEKQPWGGYMAMIADPDENLFYLDQFTAPTQDLA
ncbi:MAG: VOC family protein [Pseudomonadota bacterium]